MTISSSTLHAALSHLSPQSASSLPSSPIALDAHLIDTLRTAYLCLASIPPHLTTSELPSQPTDPDFTKLQKEWKPHKLSSKDSPESKQYDMQVWKLPSKDGKGTWFARRSVHKDIGFARFRRGLEVEFKLVETGLVKKLEIDGEMQIKGSERDYGSGGTGKPVKSVRGIGKERIVEEISAKKIDGKMEVLHLSAQFPGPTAPRDFVICCMSSGADEEDLERAEGENDKEDEGDRETKLRMRRSRPRQMTFVSRPVVDHPECPERSGYIRGQYESVEFIREIIPEEQNQSDSSSVEEDIENGVPVEQDFAEGATGAEFADPYSQPRKLKKDSKKMQYSVEWVMLSRSDPGGNVPRWMVERGTPAGIVKDAEKFLKWLSGLSNEDLRLNSDGEIEEEEAEVRAGKRARGDSGFAEGKMKVPVGEDKTVTLIEGGIKAHDTSDTDLENQKDEKRHDGDGDDDQQGGGSTSILSKAAELVTSIAPTSLLPSTTLLLGGDTTSSEQSSTQRPSAPLHRESTDNASIQSFSTCTQSPQELLSSPSTPNQIPSITFSDDDGESLSRTSSTSTTNTASTASLAESAAAAALTNANKTDHHEHTPSSGSKHLSRLLSQKSKLISRLERSLEKNRKRHGRVEDEEKGIRDRYEAEMRKEEERYKKEMAKLGRRKEREAIKAKEREERKKKEREAKTSGERRLKEVEGIVERLTNELVALGKEKEELMTENEGLRERVEELEARLPAV